GGADRARGTPGRSRRLCAGLALPALAGPDGAEHRQARSPFRPPHRHGRARRGGGPMTGWLVSVVATVAMTALSAFFVTLEFSLLAARQHRLEESAERSRSSRAALRSLNEPTVVLAGAQLGITACTFALGAVS